MATSSIFVTTCLLVLSLLPPCTPARSFPTGAVGSTCNGLISMVTDLGKKIPKSPPSPSLAPSKHQGTIEQPTQQSWSTPDFQFNPTATDLPTPAPPKDQEIIEQLIQQRSSQGFQVASS
ncbi:uncharacterized protein LOC120191290 [Hibiscus syriacus]|uniref:uncharacterized protein LOC120191290 n=1 Tax=Hibiscus syriacus TaxID=106335 RepID=UPI0019209FC1|nr:uncharacterized protein LOC120191290 [Hibiscus syriacus]